MVSSKIALSLLFVGTIIPLLLIITINVERYVIIKIDLENILEEEVPIYSPTQKCFSTDYDPPNLIIARGYLTCIFKQMDGVKETFARYDAFLQARGWERTTNSNALEGYYRKDNYWIVITYPAEKHIDMMKMSISRT